MARHLLKAANWNQWISPLVVRYEGTHDRTYHGGVGGGGAVSIASYDHDTGARETFELGSHQGDDHNAPAILVDDDGRIWAFYARHNSGDQIYYRRSTNAEDISAWGTEQTLSTGSFATSYVQAFQRSDGRIIVFFREQSAWRYRYTDDDGSTWSSAQTWLSSSDIYHYMRQHKADKDQLTVAWNWHPSTGSNQDIYLARIDLDTGDITEPGNGTPIGDLWDSGTLPITATDGLQVLSASAGQDTRLLEVNEHGEVLWAEWDGTDLSTAKYYWRKTEANGALGTIRDLGLCGSTVDDAEHARGYFGGGSVGDDGVVALAVEDSGEWKIERRVTTDDGASWTTTQINIGIFPTRKRFRPQLAWGESGSTSVWWIEGEYTSFSSFDTHGFGHPAGLTAPDVDDPPVTSGLVVRYDSSKIRPLWDGTEGDERPSAFPDTGTSAKHAPDPGTGPFLRDDKFNGQSAIQLGGSIGQIYSIPDGLSFGAGTDFTMVIVMRPLAWHQSTGSSSPGIWRSDSDTSGDEFILFNQTTGRPFIRWNGSDILKPGSGYQLPLDADAIVTWRITDSGVAEFFVDGDLKHDASHAQSAPAFGIYKFNQQANDNNRVEAYTGEMLIYDRALSTAEREELEDYLHTKWIAAAPLEITTAGLPNGTVGSAYSETLEATGGTTPYTWSITSGALPDGLSLNTSTGEVSGTPTTAETANFTVHAADDAADTDTQALSITVNEAAATAPDAPTLTQAESPRTTLTAETSEFSSDDPDPEHTNTRWQVRDAGDADWTTPVEDITTTDFLTSIAIDGMPEETDLEVRAAHGQDGVYSDWSNAVAVTSGTETPLPDTPVITDPVDEVGTDFVTVTRAAFDHSEGVGDGEPDEDGELLPYELAGQWQVRESGASWDDAVIDTGLDDLYVDVLTATFEGLNPATNYEVRFRTQDGKYGSTSLWSNVVTFTTDALPAVKPVTPTLTVDSCGWPETDVSSSAFDHPEGGATHQASRWWIGTEDADEVVRYRSVIRTDTAELTAFVWRQLAAGVNHLAVSHQDDSGRWSDRSAPVTCTILERPDVPLLTSHAAGTSLNADATFTWSMPGSGTWAFTGELSADNGANWEALFSGQETAEYTLAISGRPNGLYLLRIKACYPDAATDCSDWLTVPIRIDRTGVVSVDYQFSEFSSIPASWVSMWDPAGHVSWTLVDAELNPINEAGAGDCVGLHARHTRNLEQRESVLAFTELGKPETVDITVTFGIMMNPMVWHGWRFSQAFLTAGGAAYRALSAAETGSNKVGYASRVDTGSRGWPYSSGVCNSDSEALSDKARRAKPILARGFPDRLFSYGTPYGGGGIKMFGYREQWGRWLFKGGSIQKTGALSRGLNYSVLTESEEQEGSACRYRFVPYSMRKRVTRTVDGNYRVRVQTFGPGIDASAGPQIDFEINPDSSPPLTDWTFGTALCGYCGLYYWQMPFLTNDPGVLFLSASITAPDTTIVNGPTLGAASVVGAS